MNIVRIVPARACGWNLDLEFNESSRGLSRILEAVRVFDVVY